MKKEQTMRYPTVLTIAGSDSSGGAGIQADLKTFAANGVYGASVITALTAQNTQGVIATEGISPSMVEAQIRAVFDDLYVDVVKIGMLYNAGTANIVARLLKEYGVSKIVLDPVMISTSGHILLQSDAIEVIVEQLFPLATVITPNTDESSMLSNMPVRDSEEMFLAAKALLALGSRSVLIKGGHIIGENVEDLLFEEDKPVLRFAAPFTKTDNKHGTGCTLASAIAAFLAKGFTLSESVKQSKEYLTGALEAGASVHVGAKHGPVNHAYAPIPLLPTKECDVCA